MLEWAAANGCEMDARVCVKAAEWGHLPVLEWARGHTAGLGEGSWAWRADPEQGGAPSTFVGPQARACSFTIGNGY